MKLTYIDGLRGICCVTVSLGHMVALLLPSLYFGASHESHTKYASLIYETPLNVIFNSSAALMCFLILSGFVIPLKKFRQNEKISILGKWLDKYMRLMPMALVGVLFAWILMKLGVIFSYKMVDLSFSHAYATNWNAFEPGTLFGGNGPVYEGVIRVFLKNSQYNNPLNSLRFIWQYSLALLIFTKWGTDWKYRDILYGVTTLVTFFAGHFLEYGYYYGSAMFLGMWISDIFFNPIRKKRNIISIKLAIFFLLCGLMLISIPVGTPARGIYKWVYSIPINHTVYWICGWTLCLIAICNLEFAQKLLSASIFTMLGNISFAYYVIHWPVAISFTCGATLFLNKCMQIPYVVAAICAIIVSVPLIMFLGFVVEKYVYKNLYNLLQYSLRKLVEK